MSESASKVSPLHEKHVALGAKMADFSGWQMPIEYPTGGVAEHHTVRGNVGLFDVSHLGNALVTGEGAKDFLNTCLANDLDRIEPGKAQYTLCLDEDGGVVDDLIAYLRSDDDVFLIPNAANTAEVVRGLLTEFGLSGGLRSARKHLLRRLPVDRLVIFRADRIGRNQQLPLQSFFDVGFVEGNRFTAKMKRRSNFQRLQKGLNF